MDFGHDRLVTSPQMSWLLREPVFDGVFVRACCRASSAGLSGFGSHEVFPERQQAVITDSSLQRNVVDE